MSQKKKKQKQKKNHPTSTSKPPENQMVRPLLKAITLNLPIVNN